MSDFADLLKRLHHTPGLSDTSSHTPGTRRGEEWLQVSGRERGRKGKRFGRTARDSTSINSKARHPILETMPELPPA